MLIAEKCAKRSSPPPSGVMKPKPLESLNHLTVPVAMCVIPKKVEKGPSPNHSQSQSPQERTPTQHVLGTRNQTGSRTLSGRLTACQEIFGERSRVNGERQAHPTLS